jgi:hypothetical protein
MSSITVRVPFTVRQRGGRKVVVTPEGAGWVPARAQIDSIVVKALARAFRWRRMLESGRFASVAELAEAEKINQSYLCRVLRLTLLAPDIVEAILDGRRPDMMLPSLMGPLPAVWAQQRTAWATAEGNPTAIRPAQPFSPPTRGVPEPAGR